MSCKNPVKSYFLLHLTKPEHNMCNQGKQQLSVTTIAWHKLSTSAKNCGYLGADSEIKDRVAGGYGSDTILSDLVAFQTEIGGLFCTPLCTYTIGRQQQNPPQCKYINIQCEFAYLFFIVSVNQQVYSNSQLSCENLPLNGDKWRKEEWNKKVIFSIGWRTAERCRGLVTAERGLEKRCLVYESRWPGLPAGWLLSLRSTVPEQRQTHTHAHTFIHFKCMQSPLSTNNADKHVSTHQQLNRLLIWQRRHSHCDQGVGS